MLRIVPAGTISAGTSHTFDAPTLRDLATEQIHGMLVVEMNAGQMVEDVRLAVEGKVPVEFYGRMGGIIPSPEEVVQALEKLVRNDVKHHAEVY